MSTDAFTMMRFVDDRQSGGPGRKRPRRGATPGFMSFPPHFSGRRHMRFRDTLSRALCQAFAMTGATLFKVAMRLARNGVLDRRQSLRLVRGSICLNRIAIRLLRRGRW
ncbi:MAG: hypothetical protein P0Y66_05895 [Candidatus Kaistia colombiensis]|nr:MAG: hypothetical protein P0Y66_05895 [Kaistia sp.]